MNSTMAIGEARSTKPFYRDMSVQVFAGMALGALIGWLWPQSAEWMRTLGDLFIRLIAMFVGLIIFCAVVHGIATVREAKKVGRIAIKGSDLFRGRDDLCARHRSSYGQSPGTRPWHARRSAVDCRIRSRSVSQDRPGNQWQWFSPEHRAPYCDLRLHRRQCA